MDLPDFEKQIISPIAGQYDQMYWAQLSLFLQTPDNPHKNQQSSMITILKANAKKFPFKSKKDFQRRTEEPGRRNIQKG
jgi:hypothetical protein